MVVQYSHTIEVTTLKESTKDGAGNWGNPGDLLVETLQGRYEPNEKGLVIAGEDGSSLQYSGIVYMPLVPALSSLKVGYKVQVKKGTAVIATGTIKQFIPGQLNARLWL